MKKLSLYLIILFVIFLNLIDKFFHEDPVWVDCSIEKDLYECNDGWRIKNL